MISKIIRCDLCERIVVTVGYRLRFTGPFHGAFVLTGLADPAASEKVICHPCLDLCECEARRIRTKEKGL